MESGSAGIHAYDSTLIDRSGSRRLSGKMPVRFCGRAFSLESVIKGIVIARKAAQIHAFFLGDADQLVI